MLIPRHWHKAVGTATPPEGDPHPIAAWGWSRTSAADARHQAESRLAALASRLAEGDRSRAEYDASERPLREEVLGEVGGTDDAPEAILTRNGYGAVILNTARVAFLDVDLPRRGALSRWWRRVRGRPDDESGDALARIRAAAAALPERSFRVYRTRAGFRVLVTDVLRAPDSDDARSWFRSFGVDGLFAHLCRAQGSYRARLTPKPRRLGLRAPGLRHPRSADEQRAFERWLAEYEQKRRGWSTCTLVESIGAGRVAAEIEPILREHDRWTEATSSRPLA